MLTDPLRGGATLLFGLILISAYTLQGSADSLLTPLPGPWMAAAIVPSMIVSAALAYAIARGIPSLLLQRLLLLGVMASAFYGSGQTTRGLYVMSTFSGPVERAQITLLITGGGDGVLQAVDRTRPGPVRVLPATAEVMQSLTRGQCVRVTVERAADAERLAGAVITPEDVGPCE